MITQNISTKSAFKLDKVKYREDFDEKCSYVLCTEYGTHGLTPTLLECDGGCVSSSGDSLCGGYGGEEKIADTNLHIVHCMNNIEDCIEFHRKRMKRRA